MRAPRRCQRLGCGNLLEGRRKDARYCSETCKREAARSRDLSDGSAAPSFWERYRALRRPSRGRRGEKGISDVLANSDQRR
jgi:hypothetical protein